MDRPPAGFGPHLPGSLVLAALLVAVVVSRVAQPSRSDAAGALYSAGATWTINGRGAALRRDIRECRCRAVPSGASYSAASRGYEPCHRSRPFGSFVTISMSTIHAFDLICPSSQVECNHSGQQVTGGFHGLPVIASRIAS